MSLSRNEAGGEALTVLNLDSVPGEALIKELTAEEDIPPRKSWCCEAVSSTR